MRKADPFITVSDNVTKSFVLSLCSDEDRREARIDQVTQDADGSTRRTHISVEDPDAAAAIQDFLECARWQHLRKRY